MKNIISVYFLLFLSAVFAQSQQNIFESKRADYKNQYIYAKNEIKKSEVFNDVANWSRKFKENIFNSDEYWYGKLVEIRTDRGGTKAAVIIRSAVNGINIDYDTDNEFLTIYDDLIIKKGSYLYNQLADLAEGQFVKFKFYFVEGGDRGVFEKSITEEGSITEPEFIVKFISIGPVQ